MPSIAEFLLPERHAVAVPAMLADPVDPATGDYISLTRGFDPTDAAVLYALSVERASGSAVQDTGQRYRDQQLVDDRAAGFFVAETRRALAPLIELGQVAVETVSDASPGNDWAQLQVTFRNLRRAESPQTTPAMPIRSYP